LDDWPERFGDQVHVLNDKGLALAPWNAKRFPYGNGVFWHFHGLRLLPNRKIDIGSNYKIPSKTLKYVYLPYFNDLKAVSALLAKHSIEIKPQQKSIGVFLIVKRLIRFFLSNFSIIRTIFPFKY
jgi:hypothetical protein